MIDLWILRLSQSQTDHFAVPTTSRIGVGLMQDPQSRFADFMTLWTRGMYYKMFRTTFLVEIFP